MLYVYKDSFCVQVNAEQIVNGYKIPRSWICGIYDGFEFISKPLITQKNFMPMKIRRASVEFGKPLCNKCGIPLKDRYSISPAWNSGLPKDRNIAAEIRDFILISGANVNHEIVHKYVSCEIDAPKISQNEREIKTSFINASGAIQKRKNQPNDRRKYSGRAREEYSSQNSAYNRASQAVHYMSCEVVDYSCKRIPSKKVDSLESYGWTRPLEPQFPVKSGKR